MAFLSFSLPSASSLLKLPQNIQRQDVNENFNKTIGLISKTTTLHVHHAFIFAFSLPFLHDYEVKMPNFSFYG